MRYLLHRPDLSLRYYNCADTMIFIDGPARYAFPDAADVDALNQYPAYSQIIAVAEPELDLLPDRLGIIVRDDRERTQSRISTVLGQHLAKVTTRSAVGWAPEVGETDQPARLPINFEDAVTFLGYELSISSLKPGDAFDLVTYWRVTSDLPPQLAQFTHLLSTDGNIITQQDRLALTSASLRAGDIFGQRHHLTLPVDLAAGEYPLTIGLYTQSDGTRLQITQAGQPRGDRLSLGSILVN
jgi:hypothetical protein